ncbi:unnamed protein product [Cuscuta campestris]|uniref:RING-type domain-containing protein n=2 Tax=Cuscuta sect. Cleistogrammica TaxID=1824901 RepID=A0A484LQN1_9ASTE|nr:hypothetical protein DM860_014216 [Cuscuta australis]VFQ78822.1 unnamed protein product [Cuscuta campestris]
MGSKWRKAKLALGLNLCTYVPRTHVEDDVDAKAPPPPLSSPHADGALPSAAPPGSHSLKLSKSLSRSSKKICSICLATMKRGNGHAIFTAECSHSFHFHCIASNAKHGNFLCPICRAKWKEIPLQRPILDLPIPGKPRVSLPPRLNQNRNFAPLLHTSEPTVFDDDESLGVFPLQQPLPHNTEGRVIKINTYPEIPSVSRFHSCDKFTVLVHLSAPSSILGRNPHRAPVDLVTVLDISGSMAGTKLALLKRAMGFVIQNLGPADRLAVIAFSSTSKRLFPLGRMSEGGKQRALQAVNSLVANGGTNIAEGLRKGSKVMEDRREKNSVSSIILLSDGQDTYSGTQHFPTCRMIPVHTFGFGGDHDASSMHSIAEASGGTFSFIETESVIQEAFAQCIGGLLSVVVKELRLDIDCVHPGVLIRSLRTGSYPNSVLSDGRKGSIDVGDLYADEARDFLVTVNVPTEQNNETSLLKVRCAYMDPLTKETINNRSEEEVRIKRPEENLREAVVSIEVDRQKNRLEASEAMAEARATAEKGDLVGAASVLEKCRRALSETASGKSREDLLCLALDAELKEMQERLTSRHVYEASGRAYILSGMSSHSWQRATARGDSTDMSSLVRAYQTPSMVEMVTSSRATSPSPWRLVRPTWGPRSQPKPR